MNYGIKTLTLKEPRRALPETLQKSGRHRTEHQFNDYDNAKTSNKKLFQSTASLI